MCSVLMRTLQVRCGENIAHISLRLETRRKIGGTPFSVPNGGLYESYKGMMI